MTCSPTACRPRCKPSTDSLHPMPSLFLPPDAEGQDLYRINLYATTGFVVAAALATAVTALRIPFAVLSCVLFAGGIVAFVWAYAQALERSREQDVSVTMIFAMSGVAPAPVRRRFHLLTFVQAVVAIATASIRPFTAQAFGILAVMLGVGLAGLWSAKHGTFAERKDGRHKAVEQAARENKSHGR